MGAWSNYVVLLLLYSRGITRFTWYHSTLRGILSSFSKVVHSDITSLLAVEKIIRTRIYDSKYWKEECFALTAELLVDKGMELRYIGGIYAGNVKPTPFLCLCLKMLQIQPEKDIAVEFIRQEEYKYIRALGAMYIRLTFTSIEVYKYLEPLYNDYRKLRMMNNEGRFEIVHMDEFIDNLLRDERYCDIHLPRIQKRITLEEVGELQPYVSALDEDLDKLSSSDSEDDDDRIRKRKERSKVMPRRRSYSRERERERDVDRGRDRDRERERERERSVTMIVTKIGIEIAIDVIAHRSIVIENEIVEKTRNAIRIESGDVWTMFDSEVLLVLLTLFFVYSDNPYL
ncbi:PRP38 family protein [Brugia pahangi]